MSGMPYMIICKPNILYCSKSFYSHSHSMAPPECYICSYRKTDAPLAYKPVYHLHYSAREVRIMMGVEFTTDTKRYMCPTCMISHSVHPTQGLNVCLGDSQLHNFHWPKDNTVVCPPDSLHVDWVTIPGATIPTLQHAWQVDYAKSTKPMRVLLVAGTNDLTKGGTMATITSSILQLKNTIDDRNSHHPSVKNELVVATLFNPPKLTWFADAGPPPPGHVNRLDEITAINNWIVEFN